MTKETIIEEVQSIIKDLSEETFSTGDIDKWVCDGIKFLASVLTPEILIDLQDLYSTACSGTGDDSFDLPEDYVQVYLCLLDGVPIEIMDLREYRKLLNSIVNPNDTDKYGYIWGHVLYYKPIGVVVVVDLYYIRTPDTTEVTPELPEYTHFILSHYASWRALLSDGEFEKADAQMKVVVDSVNLVNQRFGKPIEKKR